MLNVEIYFTGRIWILFQATSIYNGKFLCFHFFTLFFIFGQNILSAFCHQSL